MSQIALQQELGAQTLAPVNNDFINDTQSFSHPTATTFGVIE
ncbi:hypothetical Protein YC6258_03181 [Gynuella sunshinyii YC6258]|uniref:Uncharacterized protein n=1 Tax=Gynuella sunshinyii YC6258 TaxID=1445510 RepID=A0A0C5VKL2_9GAMM|nr:hypothetical Protein YC6258_03181 [Gynuella sunshinyii YC6258]